MAAMTSDILLPTEIEHFIENLCPSTMEELGSKKFVSELWLEKHGRFQKLNQQAVLEANKMKDEFVKNTFILFEKIPVIIYEAICTMLWSKNVLPEILKIEPVPKNSFVACSILYHEATAVGLLEAILYHEESCEALGDSVIDLIDYCMNSVTYCISREKVMMDNPAGDIGKGEDYLIHEQNRLKFDNGIRSIVILRCLGEYLDSLPLSAASRIFETNDLPLVFVELVENPPWYAKDKDGNIRLYKVVNYLFGKLGIFMLQRYLHDELLDQLSPLVELQRWLSHLAVSQPPVISRPVILEVVPEREIVLFKYRIHLNAIDSMEPSGIDHRID
ncbi:hypothetical protein J437_LFUL008896 [Ladona fulva]|uniref:Uncharacterized protein n=1 Tax=Ladona fulva TaxID=123851 RepID=A0A8K0K6Y1_LADFU|nr:hypothetical protein J437_LFUL008896 [Ladona fulva]